MHHTSSSVLVVIAVCAICILVTLEVVFWILGVPAEARYWTLAACVLAPTLYFLIMRYIRSRVTPRR